MSALLVVPIFRAHPFQWPSKLNFPASKSFYPVPYKQHVL
jgi:hypothetical protein